MYGGLTARGLSAHPYILLDVDGVLHPLRPSGHPLRADNSVGWSPDAGDLDNRWLPSREPGTVFRTPLQPDGLDREPGLPIDGSRGDLFTGSI